MANKLRDEEYQKIKRITPLFQKIQQNYVENYELPELKKQHQVLTSLK